MKLNLGAGHVLKPKEEGWINVDKFSMDGIDVIMDLFKYPWKDFEDNSCDEFYMSHIVEHIPHEPKPSFPENYAYLVDPKVRNRWLELRNYDGFFCWFWEVWRIAKPGAKVHVLCPYGLSYPAFQDPTHTRYMVPPSFAYLTAQCQTGERWDYHIPFLYKINKCDVSILPYQNLAISDAMTNANELERQAMIFTNWNIGYEMIVELEVIKDSAPNLS